MTRAPEITVTAGQTLALSLGITATVNGQPVTDLTGWSIRSQVRTMAGDLVAELTATITDPTAAPPLASLSGSTATWPLQRLQSDVILTGPSGTPVLPSGKILFDMVASVTEIGA